MPQESCKKYIVKNRKNFTQGKTNHPEIMRILNNK